MFATRWVPHITANCPRRFTCRIVTVATSHLHTFTPSRAGKVKLRAGPPPPTPTTANKDFRRLARSEAKPPCIIRLVPIQTRPSVGPHGTTRLPLDGFSWNLILEYFSKICRENLNFIKIYQKWRVLYMKTGTRVGSCVDRFVLQWEMVQAKVVKKIKNTLHSAFFFFFCENRAFYEIMWKNSVQTDRPQMTIWRMRIACWIPETTNTHSEYVTHCFFSATTVARTRLCVNGIRTAAVLLLLLSKASACTDCRLYTVTVCVSAQYNTLFE